MTTEPTRTSEQLLSRKVRVAPSTYFVIGFIAAMPLFLGIGGVAGDEKILGAIGLVSAPLLFSYFCFQRIDIGNGVMTYRRPFFPAQSVLLSSVTQVCAVWSKDGGLYGVRSRRFHFLSGETTLCAFNPKLFSLKDLSFILSEIRAHSSAVSFDEDTRAFLRDH
jgi:hypothetical protein